MYKETLQDMVPFDALNIKPTGRNGRPIVLKNVPYEKLYPTKKPVGELKKKDMIDLLPFIPPVHHTFFLNLNTSDADIEDIGPLPYYEDEIDDPNDEEEGGD